MGGCGQASQQYFFEEPAFQHPLAFHLLWALVPDLHPALPVCLVLHLLYLHLHLNLWWSCRAPRKDCRARRLLTSDASVSSSSPLLEAAAAAG